LDIDVFTVPCEILDLRFPSKSGAKAHTLQRYRYFPNNTFEPLPKLRELPDVIQSIKNKEGCKLKGSFYKHFLTDEFTLSFGNLLLIAHLKHDLGELSYDLSHRINYLTLGDDASYERYSRWHFLYEENTI